MGEFMDRLAEDLRTAVTEVIDLPFYTEEEELLFFQLIVGKLLELGVGYLLDEVELVPDPE